MATNSRVWPDIAIPPGETLAETLGTLRLTQKDLARQMGRPVQAINEIINGKKAITAETALQLEQVLKTPAHVWLNLQAQYDLTKARLAQHPSPALASASLGHVFRVERGHTARRAVFAKKSSVARPAAKKK
jgi:addiction module HigA family antidote